VDLIGHGPGSRLGPCAEIGQLKWFRRGLGSGCGRGEQRRSEQKAEKGIHQREIRWLPFHCQLAAWREAGIYGGFSSDEMVEKFHLEIDQDSPASVIFRDAFVSHGVFVEKEACLIKGDLD
jgi:hypothetical protein